jgi:hypothetical protein
MISGPWKGVRTDMVEDLKSLLQSKTLTDFVFVVQDKQFPVHKVVLLARVPKFLEKFNQEKEFNISKELDIDPIGFAIFVEYLYSDRCAVNETVTSKLLKVGEYFGCARLISICKTRLGMQATIEKSTLSEDFSGILNQGLLHDIEFEVEGNIIKAHRVRLPNR